MTAAHEFHIHRRIQVPALVAQSKYSHQRLLIACPTKPNPQSSMQKKAIPKYLGGFCQYGCSSTRETTLTFPNLPKCFTGIDVTSNAVVLTLSTLTCGKMTYIQPRWFRFTTVRTTNNPRLLPLGLGAGTDSRCLDQPCLPIRKVPGNLARLKAGGQAPVPQMPVGWLDYISIMQAECGELCRRDAVVYYRYIRSCHLTGTVMHHPV